MSNEITGKDVQDMVSHWLSTPTNGYRGSGYGQDVKSLLQQSQNSGKADELLAKMRVDIPVLQVMPQGSTNIYAVTSGVDRLDIVIEVAGQAFAVGG